LNAMREVMVAEGHKNVKPDEVVANYSFLAGGSWSTDRGKSLMQNLLAKGYHAIVDDMDAGVYGESPLVLIDPSRFTDKVATPLVKINRAPYKELLVELPNRR
jgi:hypothetical protein